MSKKQEKVEDRRNFLKLASLGTVLGGAVAVSGTSVQAATPVEETKSGYRETDHVNSFYESTRF